MVIKEEINKKGFESSDSCDSDEVRIKNIQSAFQSSENIKESCHYLIDSVEDSLEYLKVRRMDVSIKLCEALAKKESLRKKDYNLIMDEIYSILDQKESNAKNHFVAFIEDQKKFTQSLKNIIVNISDYSVAENADKNALLKAELSEIAEIQEKRKEDVMGILMDFQETHKRLMEYLESLLDKGDIISIRDIKHAKYIISNRFV
ncbi:hypothetical protein [Pelodictyon phaeoclathratiforme]|jgi:hypothetical protein|uniref:Uncharacterized protein n=1 Tax=Pelodictyon phaeoclathratiforme (strain DSM 5477 / BU-1) TaxID=324925 RepID=B4SBJ4_PELPB|nr:hypothetical protein [Pelodictyon phaeoclathratiforme]ACF44048.1 conserved hypothetical protein [Pelodictyon phaeoclathratiforme BU-1]MBV5288271.1 hypothetical protein [Pelodictyon phaeoclathratiforme]